MANQSARQQNFPSNSVQFTYWKNTALQYTDCNLAYAQILGFTSPLDLIGKTDQQLDRTTAKVFSENDQAALQGKTVTGELSLTDSDAKQIQLRFIKEPLFNIEGQVMGIYCHAFDDNTLYLPSSTLHSLHLSNSATQSLNDATKSFAEVSQECLDSIRDDLENIIACMPSNVYWLDRNCTLIGGNANLANVFGLRSHHELCGLTYEEMSKLAGWTQGQGESFKQGEIQVMETGLPALNVEEPPVLINDSLRYYISSKVPLFNKHNEVIGVVGISTDFTEMKQAQLALQEAKEKAEIANASKSYFLASLSHEIRTPLSHIISLSHLLRNSQNSLSLNEMQEYLANIHDAGTDLLELMNDIILYAQMETGHFSVELQDVNLDESVQNILRYANSLVLNKKISLSYQQKIDQPCLVRANAKCLRQILVNLMTNACKFTQQGSITITLAPEQNTEIPMVRISVTDTGIGIHESKIEQLFQKFSQVHSESDDNRMGRYKGVGLGLAICRELVTAMGGIIGVESKWQQGSTFFFTLPLALQASVKTAPSKASLANDFEFAQLKLLLVEDDRIAQRYAQMVAQSLHCQLDIAQTASEGFQSIEQNSYDLILMDIGLPDISGLELVEKIHALHPGFKTPLVVITAQDLEAKKRETLKDIITDFLDKPLSQEKLAVLLHRHCLPKSPEVMT